MDIDTVLQQPSRLLTLLLSVALFRGIIFQEQILLVLMRMIIVWWSVDRLEGVLLILFLEEEMSHLICPLRQPRTLSTEIRLMDWRLILWQILN